MEYKIKYLLVLEPIFGETVKKQLFSVASILEELFKKPKSPLSEGYFLCQLHQMWEELAGEEIAKVAHPVGFKNHRLTIALPSSSHVQEMHFVKETLRQKINQIFPDKKVKRIYLQVKNSKPLNFKSIKKIIS